MTWAEVKSRYIFWALLGSFVATFLVTPFFSRETQPLNLFLIASVISATLAVGKTKRQIAFGGVLSAFSFTATIMLATENTSTALLFFYLSTAAFFVFLTIMLLKRIFSSPHVNTNTLLASVCLYFAIAVLWAMAFGIIAIAIPGSFVSGGAPLPAAQVSGLLYFSVVTLTTLGYGDITPMSGPAQSFAAVEALFGQIYLTVLVARLVGLHIAERHTDSKETGGQSC